MEPQQRMSSYRLHRPGYCCPPACADILNRFAKVARVPGRNARPVDILKEAPWHRVSKLIVVVAPVVTLADPEDKSDCAVEWEWPELADRRVHKLIRPVARSNGSVFDLFCRMVTVAFRDYPNSFNSDYF